MHGLIGWFWACASEYGSGFTHKLKRLRNRVKFRYYNQLYAAGIRNYAAGNRRHSYLEGMLQRPSCFKNVHFPGRVLLTIGRMSEGLTHVRPEHSELWQVGEVERWFCCDRSQ